MVEDMGVATGVDLEAMIEAAAQAERIVGRTLPSQVLRAGPRTRTFAERQDRPMAVGFCAHSDRGGRSGGRGRGRHSGAVRSAPRPAMPHGCARCWRSPRSSARPAGSTTSSSSPPRRPAARWTRRRCRSRAGSASRARCGRSSTSACWARTRSGSPPTRSTRVSAWPTAQRLVEHRDGHVGTADDEGEESERLAQLGKDSSRRHSHRGRGPGVGRAVRDPYDGAAAVQPGRPRLRERGRDPGRRRRRAGRPLRAHRAARVPGPADRPGQPARRRRAARGRRWPRTSRTAYPCRSCSPTSTGSSRSTTPSATRRATA